VRKGYDVADEASVTRQERKELMKQKEEMILEKRLFV
jgi:hypothetical protein